MDDAAPQLLLRLVGSSLLQGPETSQQRGNVFRGAVGVVQLRPGHLVEVGEDEGEIHGADHATRH
ncbi:hypothetical protein [Streptomyces sp. NPDC093223]|uniref:hypothetical protein n=1 Tax=Streptomyces sp. NPDC093223 TaxID=3366033 RepID=UPI0037F97F53